MTWKVISKQLNNIDLHFIQKINKTNKKNLKLLKFNQTAHLVKTQFKNIKKKLMASNNLILNQLSAKVSRKNVILLDLIKKVFSVLM